MTALSTAAEYKRIPLSQLHESPTNPRKTFDGEYLKELALSIKENGVVQPIVVRTNAKGFEIVAGACRFRASKIAHVADIPATIRTLTDAQVVTIQLIENLQRRNVSPLEEAQGFSQLINKALMGDSVLTPEQISEKVGKSIEYVYARIKLNDLGKAGRDLLDKGELPTEHGVQISRLDAADQERAIKFCNDEKEDSGEMPNVKELRDWIKTDVRMAKSRQVALDAVNAIRGKGEKAVLISTLRSWQPDTAFLPKGTLLQAEYEQVSADAKDKCNHTFKAVSADSKNAGVVSNVCTNKKCKVHWDAPSPRQQERPTAPSKAQKAAQKERERKNAMARKAKEIAEDRGMALVIDKTKLDKKDLQLIVQVLSMEVHYNTTDGISRRHGLRGNGYRSSIGTGLVTKAKTPADLWKLIFELALCNSHIVDNKYSKEMARLQADVHQRYGVTPDALKKTALAELRASYEKTAPKKPPVQTSTKPKAKAAPKKTKPAKKSRAKKKAVKKAKHRG